LEQKQRKNWYMNLTTQVKAQELGSWRCEVFAIGGKCIAWAITPPNWQMAM
jgi:hypothetical protein